MKRIAIFCDGTWNRSDAAAPTNVVRLAQAVRHTAPDGTAQVVSYLEGVGSGRGSTRVARELDEVAGGLLGWGLDATIEEAYRLLVFAYEPGDEVFVFGFSRGAYTARSLVGLIRAAGIAPRAHVHRVGEAMARYRDRGAPRPDDPRSYPWRAAFAPDTATGADELAWRRAQGLAGRAILLEVPYVGVWDTVGALGVPAGWIAAGLLNRGHRFHDDKLSAMVLSARHAVALDERRPTFEPTLWDARSLDALNRAALGLPPGTALGAREALPYRQEWFPGDHGGVGGGDRPGLSAWARAWVAEGAERAGLAFADGVLDEWRGERNVMEPLVARLPRFSGWRLLRLGLRDRRGPADAADVHPAVIERIRRDPSYRPRSLDRVWAALGAEVQAASDASRPSAVTRVAPRR